MFVEGEVPADMLEKWKEYRLKLIEKAAESDDALIDKYLAGTELTEAELMRAIRAATLSGKFYPVLGGDGRGFVLTTILDAVVNHLPSPLHKPPLKAIHQQTQEN